MKRIGLIEQFHGEPNPGHEGLAAEAAAHDEVALDVVQGTVSFIVPAEAPDDRVHEQGAIDRHVHCHLKLENGIELNLWISGGAEGVDLRMLGPKKVLVSQN